MVISQNIWEDVSMSGLYVGEDSDIPNTNGMRNDVVASFAGNEAAGSSLAGWMLCRRISLEGRHQEKGNQRKKMVNTTLGRS